MVHRSFPAIDPVETGRNIVRLRKERGLSVRDIQAWFNFEEPRAIYKWQSGQTLPSVDNLYALSVLLEVPMDSVIVGMDSSQYSEPQEIPAAHHFYPLSQGAAPIPASLTFPRIAGWPLVSALMDRPRALPPAGRSG